MLKKTSLMSAVIFMCLAAPAWAQPAQPKPAESFTKTVHAAFLSKLPFSNKDDFDAASRGLIATLPGGQIKDENGTLIWDMKSYTDFMTSESAPDTVNPSLWRQELLNNQAGLFEVTKGIHQVRGLDLSNMTIVEGQTGLIIIDPLISTETAAAALKLYLDHVAQKPVVAVIYSHSHVDHYGGVKGVVSEDDVKSGKVKIYAPLGFLEHAVSENVYAGTAMSRRALYMYGALLPKNAQGQVGTGLGKTTSVGTVTLIPPTHIVGKNGEAKETITIDGLEIEFQMTPGTEAPAEMNMYFPEYNALCMAENATRTQHNLLTLRGAQVRDAAIWSKYLDDAIHLYVDKVDVAFAQHHWPTWGRENIHAFLSDQRDMYKYLNDQTLRLINKGYTPMEIAETLKELPSEQATKWYNRDYYGSMSHNVRAVYQRYLGFYDGNPANLNPLQPVDAAKNYVDYMGGSTAIIEKARNSFDKGDYRWVAEVMKHVVFADPDNKDGKELLADALEQMGYQTENGTWRSIMLMGAFELRNGVPKTIGSAVSPDTIKAMTLGMYFDYMGIRLNGPEAAKLPETKINWDFTDTHQHYLLTLRNGALTHREGVQDDNAALSITLTREILDAITLENTTFEQAIKDKSIELSGDPAVLKNLLALQEDFDLMFNVVTP